MKRCMTLTNCEFSAHCVFADTPRKYVTWFFQPRGTGWACDSYQRRAAAPPDDAELSEKLARMAGAHE